MTSHATLNCERIIAACHDAAEGMVMALDAAEGGDLADVAEAKRNHKAVEGMIALATATLAEGHKTMQVSTEDYLLLQDYYRPLKPR